MQRGCSTFYVPLSEEVVLQLLSNGIKSEKACWVLQGLEGSVGVLGGMPC